MVFMCCVMEEEDDATGRGRGFDLGREAQFIGEEPRQGTRVVHTILVSKQINGVAGYTRPPS